MSTFRPTVNTKHEICRCTILYFQQQTKPETNWRDFCQSDQTYFWKIQHVVFPVSTASVGNWNMCVMHLHAAALAWSHQLAYYIMHSGSKWLKLSGNKFTCIGLRNFLRTFQQIHIVSVSGHCMRFIFMICQTVAGISITSQFHEFCKSNFRRVFVIWPNCG